jgi:tetraacyldisaccharide 4'-kinase
MRAPEFWNRRGFAATLLAPLGLLYGASVDFKARHARPRRVRARVICVGNLTAGGSGKTPVALAIGAQLKAQKRNVYFLTRGYGGREMGPVLVSGRHRAADVGDEALLLARCAPTILARDRAQGAALAVEQGAEVIVMDDGHQNFTLAKDLSLVVVDGETGFGNGLMIPAGPLRESVRKGLARADAVIVMGDGDPDLQSFAGPVLRARLAAEGDTFRGRPVFAFAGIGRPEKFLATLRAAGAQVTGCRFFTDHHPFREGEIDALRQEAGGAQLVTTEKDFARLAAKDRADIAVLPVHAEFEDPASLDRLLARLLDTPLTPV